MIIFMREKNIPPEINFKKDGVLYCWLGTAGVYICDGKNGFVIDPYVSRHGMARVFLGLPLKPELCLIKQWADVLGNPGYDAVLVSHSHFDHLLDAPFFALERGVPLTGSSSTAMAGRGYGLDRALIDEVRPGDSRAYGDFTVTFIESAHGPAFAGRIPYPGAIGAPLVPPRPATAYRLGTTFSFLVEHPLGTAVHHGSAGFIKGMYDGIRADKIFLGIAGRGGNTAEYIENVVIPLQARTVIPVHFDNFFRPLNAPMKYVPGLHLKEFLETASRYNSFDIVFPPFVSSSSFEAQTLFSGN